MTAPSGGIGRRRRRWPWLVALVVLAGGAVVADGVARAYAEDRIRTELSAELPDGSRPVSVDVRGLSFLAQYAQGSLDDVVLDAPRVVVGSGAVAARFELHGVPASGSGSIRTASGSVRVDGDELSRIALPSGTSGRIRLRAGAIELSTSAEILGTSVSVTVTLVPSVDGSRVLLRPTHVRVGDGTADVDLGTLIPGLSSRQIPVCAAEYLPRGARLTRVRVSGGALELSATGDDLPLTRDLLAQHGSC